MAGMARMAAGIAIKIPRGKTETNVEQVRPLIVTKYLEVK